MEKNTYTKLVKQLAELACEMERVRRIERSGAIAEIRAQMREYGIKPSELVGRKRGGSPAPARYLNPETEPTWTGRGPHPQWLDGKNSKHFLIVRPEQQHFNVRSNARSNVRRQGVGLRVQPLMAGT
ncbi:H-NS histone family protein [Paraburkholderia sp.]|uniref:H-NS histone family protein n=1 Tax=Paraburkholderia sp. TaxID=1926495 RepID=UPI002D5FAE5C|nr:H-NS histone family protein [Paraburkholderia sp.]HZZ02683.1 H-NS histone family protein [Paraburkholderia sp.]